MTDAPPPQQPQGPLSELAHAGADIAQKSAVAGAAAAGKSPRFAIVCFSCVAMFAFWLAYLYLTKNVAEGGGGSAAMWKRLNDNETAMGARMSAIEAELNRIRGASEERKATDAELRQAVRELLGRLPK